ncbi:MAG: hypothetical protein WA085_12645 [Sphingobium sp.]
MSGAAAEEQIDDDLNDDVATVITDEDEGEAGDRGDDFKPDGEAEPALDPAALDEIASEPDEDVSKPNGMIPKARFDEVNNAKKTAEQREAGLLAELEQLRNGVVKSEAAAEPAAAAPGVADLEDAYTDALMDGDRDKARELRMQINAIIRDSAVHEIDQRNTQATESQSITVAALAVIDEYPQFDDTGEHANPEAIAEMVELRDFYITSKGMKPAEAITKAAEKVAKLFGLVAPTAAEPDAEPAVDERTKASIKRGAAVAATQPNTSAVGVGSREDGAKANIQTMSEEQFEALPDAEKRRMRGD